MTVVENCTAHFTCGVTGKDGIGDGHDTCIISAVDVLRAVVKDGAAAYPRFIADKEAVYLNTFHFAVKISVEGVENRTAARFCRVIEEGSKNFQLGCAVVVFAAVRIVRKAGSNSTAVKTGTVVLESFILNRGNRFRT